MESGKWVFFLTQNGRIGANFFAFQKALKHYQLELLPVAATSLAELCVSRGHICLIVCTSNLEEKQSYFNNDRQFISKLVHAQKIVLMHFSSFEFHSNQENLKQFNQQLFSLPMKGSVAAKVIYECFQYWESYYQQNKVIRNKITNMASF